MAKSSQTPQPSQFSLRNKVLVVGGALVLVGSIGTWWASKNPNPGSGPQNTVGTPSPNSESHPAHSHTDGDSKHDHAHLDSHSTHSNVGTPSQHSTNESSGSHSETKPEVARPGANSPSISGNSLNSPNSGSISTSGETVTALEKPKPLPVDDCFKMQYRHKKLKSHRSGEACTQHQNQFSLNVPEGLHLNTKSICVRVNGDPVEFKVSSSQNILIQEVAGPHSLVTISYCTGKVLCQESCQIQKDEFMAAISGDSDAGLDSGEYTSWSDKGSKGPSQDEVALVDQMKKIKNATQGGGKKSANIFKGWIAKSAPKTSCQASRSPKTLKVSSR